MVLKLNDSSSHRDGNCLRTIAGPEFFHDVLDVDFDSLFGNEKPFCDIAVPVSSRDVFEDLDLAVG